MSDYHQPRYVAYCRAHGRTPSEMRAADEIAWPGGRMAGFILWISERRRAWFASCGYRHDAIVDERAFDGYLSQGQP